MRLFLLACVILCEAWAMPLNAEERLYHVIEHNVPDIGLVKPASPIVVKKDRLSKSSYLVSIYHGVAPIRGFEVGDQIEATITTVPGAEPSLVELRIDAETAQFKPLKGWNVSIKSDLPSSLLASFLSFNFEASGWLAPLNPDEAQWTFGRNMGTYRKNFESSRLTIAGRTFHLPLKPDPNDKKDLEQYTHAVSEILGDQPEKIYGCFLDLEDYTEKFNYYAKANFGTGDDLDQFAKDINLASKIILIESKSKSFDNKAVGWFGQYTTSLEGLSGSFEEKLQKFESDTDLIVSMHSKLSDMESITQYYADIYLDYLTDYAKRYYENILEKTCQDPAPDLKTKLDNIEMRRLELVSRTEALINKLSENRKTRVDFLMNAIPKMRQNILTQHAKIQGVSLSDLQVKLGQSIELIKLGEEILTWKRFLSLQRHTKNLDTAYLQYFPSLTLLADQRKKLESYRKAIELFSKVPAAMKNTYLDKLKEVEQKISLIEGDIKEKGWEYFFEEQKWNVTDMKNYLEYYPSYCKDLIENYLEKADATSSEEQFRSLEYQYFDLVKSCDEKSI